MFGCWGGRIFLVATGRVDEQSGLDTCVAPLWIKSNSHAMSGHLLPQLPHLLMKNALINHLNVSQASLAQRMCSGAERGSVNQLSLYTSPSLPNITLGLPATATATAASNVRMAAALQSPSSSVCICAFIHSPVLLQVTSAQPDGGLQPALSLSPPFLSGGHLTPYLAEAGAGTGGHAAHSPLLQHMVLMEQSPAQSPLVTGRSFSDTQNDSSISGSSFGAANEE